MRVRRPFQPARADVATVAGGTEERYSVRLSRSERALLRSLPEQLHAVLASDDAADRESPALRRLSPPAYRDPSADAEWQLLMGEELRRAQTDALATLAASSEETEIDRGTAETWLTALNQLRLVLGTDLGVGPDGPGRPDDASNLEPPEILYHWLTWLQGELVETLAARLEPRPSPEGPDRPSA